jgi:PAS domain S-box-containing protein
VQRPDGSERFVEARADFLVRGGERVAMISAIRDVTERHVADATLRESEARYRTLFEAMDQGFCVVEVLVDARGEPADYRFLETNPSFERLTGLYGAMGKTALELVPDLDRFWVDTYGTVALTGQPVRFENHAPAMGGRWFDVYAFRLGGGDSRLVAILFTNITERKRAERIQQDFIAMASHDLLTPITVLRARAQLLQRRQSYDEASMTSILEQTTRMERMITDLRELVQVEGAQPTLRVAPVDLGELAHQAADRVRSQRTGHSVRIEAPRVPIVGQWDPDRLGQVLDNLLGNAIKYSPAGGEVVIRVESAPGEARLSVTDEGPGIPPTLLPHLFERFYRGEHHAGAAGLGLGLYISQMLVEAHGGRIWVTAGTGSGSTFTIALPFERR